MLTFRELTLSDTEQAIDIVNSRPDVFMGYSDEAFKTDMITSLPLVIENPSCFNIGIFEEGRLIGFCIMKEVLTQPAWVWGHWILRKADQAKIISLESFKLLEKAGNMLFEEMEQRRGLRIFYVAYRYNGDSVNDLRSIHSGDRVLEFIAKRPQYGGVRLTKYKFYTDSLIPANTMPQYSYQQAILGDRTWPMDLGIRMAMLAD